MKLCAHVEGAGAAMRRNGSAPSASALVAPPERKPAPELDASARKALVYVLRCCVCVPVPVMNDRRLGRAEVTCHAC